MKEIYQAFIKSLKRLLINEDGTLSLMKAGIQIGISGLAIHLAPSELNMDIPSWLYSASAYMVLVGVAFGGSGFRDALTKNKK
jgi:hypothetical protein